MRFAAPACAVLALAASPLAHAQQSTDAAEPSYTLTANVTLTSEYRYRGLMQTNRLPAVQGGIDFSHASGFYLGNWNSTISWLGDSNADVSAPLEMDFYGGYKGTLDNGITYDAGLLQYYYPGDYPSGYVSPDTTEIYASLGYGPVNVKYSHALTDLFGFADSKNSYYLEANGNFDTGFWGLAINAHVGHQYVNHVDDASYTDWRLGLTKDLGNGLSVAVSYVDTNADRTVYTNTKGRYMGRSTALVSVTKTF